MGICDIVSVSALQRLLSSVELVQMYVSHMAWLRSEVVNNRVIESMLIATGLVVLAILIQNR
jgi:hypothetical protein